MTFASTLFPLLFLGVATSHSQEPVATFRWTPTTHNVYVRGTLPVPSTFAEGGDFLELVHPKLADPSPVQIESVVRGPSGNLEVIEVIAMVPATDPPIRWGVLARRPESPSPAPLPPSHEALPTDKL